MDKLISIIVPVYKVEKYLCRCVDSILAQTYQNIEALLIDDGSPDSSGDICDEYAEKDSRVRVFHKENGGVSSARNLGLKEAKGDFIGFVDADDYIDNTMYEILLNNLIKEQADISVCSYYQENSAGEFHKHWPKEEYLTICGDHQIECLISNKYYTCSCWDRLFKRELIGNITFDESVSFYEDLLFLYEVTKQSKKTIFISEPLYYYCNNDASSAARKPFDDKKMDIIRVSEYIMDDIKNGIPPLYRIAKREYMRNNILCAQLAAEADYTNTENIALIRKNTRHGLLLFLISDASMGYKRYALLIALNWKWFVSIAAK